MVSEAEKNILFDDGLKEFPHGCIIASSPGRADFLNTHQDYKLLPVVPVALELRTYVAGGIVDGDDVIVKSLTMKRVGEPGEDRFNLRSFSLRGGGWFGDYVRGIVSALKKRGFGGSLRGVYLVIDSDVPVAAGLASSAALEVAVLKFFDSLFNLGLSRMELAEMAYEAERKEFKIPCGRLDQYGATYGGIIKLSFRPRISIEEFGFRNFFLIVADSGIRHSTAEIHPVRQREIDEGLTQLIKNQHVPQTLRNKLKHLHYETPWEEISEEEVAPFLPNIDERSAKRILFTLKMQRSTEVAIKILRNESFKVREVEQAIGKRLPENLDRLSALGEIVDYQHLLLRDLYDLSLPKLERIRDAMMQAGSLGAKISGAGMGGAIIAVCRTRTQGQKILRAALEAGAIKGWVSGIGTGAEAKPLNISKGFRLGIT